MKMNKSILTGMTALSLFATSAAAATSAVTPIVSNASAKKAVKHTYPVPVLAIAKSKGHATHYYVTPSHFRTTKSLMRKGFPVTTLNIRGYVLKNKRMYFKLKGNHIVRTSKTIPTFVSKSHKAIKDSTITTNGTYRITKAFFDKLNKEQMR